MRRVLGSLAAAVTLAALASGVFAAEPTAEEILNPALSPWSLGVTGTAEAVQYLPNGKTRVFSLRYRRFADAGADRSLVTVTAPPDLAGTAFLSVTGRDGAVRRWTVDKPGKPATEITPDKAARPFLGDFSYRDLDARYGRAPVRVLGTATLDGMSCSLLEAVVPTADKGVERIQHWVLRDKPVRVKTEVTDREGRALHVLKAGNIETRGEAQFARKWEAGTPADDTKTIINFTDLRDEQAQSEAAFSPDRLGTD